MATQALQLDGSSRVPFLDISAMSLEVGDELERVWVETVETSAFIGGARVERFEEAWASYCERRHAIGVANGTDALELTLRALGIGPGDEVVVPANTFIATAEAVVLAGAIPTFADVDDRTLLATAQTLEAAITSKTAAIIVVALFGNMPRMDEIVRLAQRHGVALIEDTAQAHGATWQGARAGSFGVAASFSFYPGKNLGAFGDGGAIVTDDALLAARLRSMADHGRAAGSKYDHPLVGRNSRLDALQAAVLHTKLGRLDAWNACRREAMEVYAEQLDPTRARRVELEPDTESAHHLNVVRVRDRDRVRQALDRAGVDTGIHYPVPCHVQEGYRAFWKEPLPVAEAAAEEIVSLPLFPHIEEDQVTYVCDMLNELAGELDATDD